MSEETTTKMNIGTDDPAARAERRAHSIPAITADWWQRLQPYWPDGTPNRTPGRAEALNGLRHAATVLEAALTPAVIGGRGLYARLGGTAAGAADRLPWIAAAAMGLAHVSAAGDLPPARAAARAGVDPGWVTDLFAAREPEAFAAALTRLVRRAPKGLDPGAVSIAATFWDHPDKGPEIARRWAYDFYTDYNG